MNMEATQVLMEEHRAIERVLVALESAAEMVEEGRTVRPALFIEATDFARGFVDGCHHKKEERVLFKSLVAHGLPSRGEPVQVMLEEHEQARKYVGLMRNAAEKWAGGETSSRQEVLSNAREYASLLRRHIAKEDGVLFPMADKVIPQGEQGDILAQFEHIEHEETGEDLHERYLALAGRLEEEATYGHSF
jgi:hemerythrin-like domain-containing protein